ncbi:MAG TPA: hypothetical protein VMT00_02130 [Thermoanaerobaculia bacterium]|nr:hypothetical protein [Thermoanaerobaculia bacterium]
MLRRIVVLAFAALTASLSFSCSEISRDTAPVEMVATVNQEIQLIDFADAGCGDLGTILLRAITKRTDVSDTRFLDIRLQRLRVSYVRTDGGSLIPQPFVQTISGILPVNGTATLNRFFVFEVNALTQAPFAALQPNNGGIDPETGQPFVKMDVILEIFGETLSGENVATTARFPLTFCFNCGGCR